jgi:predicted DNA-binding antitoxin AbrB/MazE fold protein
MQEIIGVVENGQIKLPRTLRLPDGSRVRVIVDDEEPQQAAYDREALTEEDVVADLRWASGKRLAS